MKLRWIGGMLVAAVLASCTQTVMIKPGTAMNPGPAGGATSVHVWVLPLRGPVAFRQAGPALVEGPAAALGNDLVGEPWKLVLEPGKPVEIKLSDLSADVQYIGFAAVFSQTNADDWKAIVPLGEVNKKVFFLNDFKVTVESR